MKKQTLVNCLLAAALVLAGEATHAKEKPVRERGWIGGNYECAKSSRSLAECLCGADRTFYTFPAALAKSQKAGMLVKSLGTNTPAYLAGLREGDLILATGGQPVTDWRGFWQTVNGSHPGAPLVIKAYRAGQTVEYQVTVGREKYQNTGFFTVGLPGFWDSLHPVPTREAPSCSLIALGYERADDRPVDFASVKEQYQHACQPEAKQTGYDTDWRVWLAIMEVKKGKTILAQELVPAAK